MTLLTNHKKSASGRVFSSDQIVQILAFDGGGLKGLFSAAAIESLEDQIGHSIVNHFDIITGTSTGGLIALSLGAGKSGKDIVGFFQNDGPRIFPNRGNQRIFRWWRSWFLNKYANQHLQKTLKSAFKDEVTDNDILLRDSAKRLIIPTFYAASSSPRLLKTPHDTRYINDWKLPMWAVAMATSAAPTYFPSFSFRCNTYLDGGLWANNPSLLGVVEALEMGASLANIRVLNITTTTSNSNCLRLKLPILPLSIPFNRSGKLLWVSRLLDIVMQAGSRSMTNMYLHQLLAAGNLAVIDDQLDSGHARLDDIDYEEFYTRGCSAAEHAFSKVKYYFDHDAAMYTPSKGALDSD